MRTGSFTATICVRNSQIAGIRSGGRKEGAYACLSRRKRETAHPEALKDSPASKVKGDSKQKTRAPIRPGFPGNGGFYPAPAERRKRKKPCVRIELEL